MRSRDATVSRQQLDTSKVVLEDVLAKRIGSDVLGTPPTTPGELPPVLRLQPQVYARMEADSDITDVDRLRNRIDRAVTPRAFRNVDPPAGLSVGQHRQVAKLINDTLKEQLSTFLLEIKQTVSSSPTGVKQPVIDRSQGRHRDVAVGGDAQLPHAVLSTPEPVEDPVQIDQEETTDDEEESPQVPSIATPQSTSKASTTSRVTAVATALPKSNEKGIYMPKFDGTDWVVFTIKFNTFCARYNFSEEEKLQRLILALEGEAFQVLHVGNADQWTLKKLWTALDARYGQHSKSLPTVYDELQTFRRRPGQSLRDLADNILRTARQTSMDQATKNTLCRMAFVQALKDYKPLQHHIERKDPLKTSMERALELAIKYEASHGADAAVGTRLDAATWSEGTPQELLQVAPYGPGNPSPLMQLMERNCNQIDTLQKTMENIAQAVHSLLSVAGSPQSERQGGNQAGHKRKFNFKKKRNDNENGQVQSAQPVEPPAAEPEKSTKA